METVISQSEIDNHSINKYKFKVLSKKAVSDISADSTDEVDSFSKNSFSQEQESDNSEQTEVKPLSKSSKDELIESLLQKTDEMSSNFIKMQMKLEAKDEECKKALEAERAKAFEEGKQSGAKEAKEEMKSEHDAILKQYTNSIQTLHTSAEEFKVSVKGIKEELIHAALDIAKEVISSEVNNRSSEIATLLAQELISEIQSSSEVTIKVNPNDKVAVEQALGALENVKVISDNAVSIGGVIVLSDAGNIDGNIMKRYERVKNVVLEK